MAQLAPSLPTPRTDAEMETAIARYFEEIDRLRQLMAKDQIEIDQLKTETRAILAELKAA